MGLGLILISLIILIVLIVLVSLITLIILIIPIIPIILIIVSRNLRFESGMNFREAKAGESCDCLGNGSVKIKPSVCMK